MADLQKGHTFATGQEVTADSLNNLVDNASVLNITSADVKTDHRLPQLNNIVPSSGVGDLWFDTGAAFGAQGGEFKARSGGVWHSAALNAETVFSYTGTPLAGEVVVLDTTADNTVVRTTTAADTGVVGVVVQSPENNKVRVCRDGYAQVKVGNDPVPARGDYITSSTTEGEAVAAPSMTDGVFGRLVQVDPSDSTIWYALIFPVKANIAGTSILASKTIAPTADTVIPKTDADGNFSAAAHTWTTLRCDVSIGGVTSDVNFSIDSPTLNAGELLIVQARDFAVRNHEPGANGNGRTDRPPEGWRILIRDSSGKAVMSSVAHNLRPNLHAQATGENPQPEDDLITRRLEGGNLTQWGEATPGTTNQTYKSGLWLHGLSATYLVEATGVYTCELQYFAVWALGPITSGSSTMNLKVGAPGLAQADIAIQPSLSIDTWENHGMGTPTFQLVKR